jgi:hypothetical protein
VKKFRMIQLGCAIAAFVAVLVELGAGHKFG